MISILIAEATVCDFKETLEDSWLKSVSAFANTAGGSLFFGVDNFHNVVGLAELQKDVEDISKLIKERISPTPRFIRVAFPFAESPNENDSRNRTDETVDDTENETINDTVQKRVKERIEKGSWRILK